MPNCPSPGCAKPTSSNGVACHDHFVALPSYLTAAWFRNRSGFTHDWLARVIVAELRGQPCPT